MVFDCWFIDINDALDSVIMCHLSLINRPRIYFFILKILTLGRMLQNVLIEIEIEIQAREQIDRYEGEYCWLFYDGCGW